MCVGAALLVGSVAVRVVAAPALVRFPLNVDETTRYKGTATTFVDQATLLQYAQPKREPLEISRHVHVVSGNFSHGRRRRGRHGEDPVRPPMSSGTST